jgi:uncharacterized protein
MLSMHKKLFIAGVFLATLCASAALASTPQPPAVPRTYVVDLAGVLRSDVKAQLSAYLQDLERKTTAQVLVLTVLSLDGEDIEGFSIRTAEQWKLGQKGKDNGALIVVAVNDRKYRIEVGYGLEGVLPDSMVGSIGRDYFVPYFQKGDFNKGIFEGTAAVIGTIAKHENVRISSRQSTGGARGGHPRKPLTAFQKIIYTLFGIVLLVLCIKNPRQCFILFLLFSMGGRRGGWSGGGGGGFGGGGGGGFGGGGASGGW